ncbi:hypothetical protein OF83DRAFT_387110 [Amylostereum chailletii]|nr:hypothetical protein OF83DRAFT_387110 [Amylostereum chailletii]
MSLILFVGTFDRTVIICAVLCVTLVSGSHTTVPPLSSICLFLHGGLSPTWHAKDLTAGSYKYRRQWQAFGVFHTYAMVGSGGFALNYERRRAFVPSGCSCCTGREQPVQASDSCVPSSIILRIIVFFECSTS